MTNVKELPSNRPDLKLVDVNGKQVSIASVATKDGEYRGEKVTYYTANLSNGKTLGINRIIYEICQRDPAPPTIGTIKQVKGGNGRIYWTLA